MSLKSAFWDPEKMSFPSHLTARREDVHAYPTAAVTPSSECCLL